MAIQWRPEINPLTVPQSWRIRFIPVKTADVNDLAADIALRHPNFSKADILTILKAEDEAIKERLLNGEQVTKTGSFSWSLSFTGRLDSPDDPLPPLEDCLHVNVRISPPFTAHLHQNGQTVRLPEEKKLPLISAAEDAVLDLPDVLSPDGVLLLTGGNLAFDRDAPGSGECLIEGARSGSAVQSRFVRIEPGEIMLMPTVPEQDNPWNNEYTVSVSVRYSERGSLREGTYARMLRAPLTVAGFGGETGILTGSTSSPYVSITGGAASANETLRIQALLDLRADTLLLSLLDMKEKGKAGQTVTAVANGEYELQGFAGSAVSSLTVRVNSFAALKEMIRNNYNGRLVDVLRIETA